MYQLGTVIYEMLAGYNPQVTPDEITDEIVLDVRPILGELGGRISELIGRMLRQQPDERPPAEEVLDALVLIHRDYCYRAKELTGRFV